MSITSFILDIKTRLFGLNKPKSLTPTLDEYVPDLEIGEGGFYRRIITHQSAYEIDYDSHYELYYDLEIGDKSIVYDDYIIDINLLEQTKNIEKHVSFMDIVNYFNWKNIEIGI